MATKNSMDLFVLMLSDLRHSAERSTKISQELAQVIQEPRIKDALVAREFLVTRTIATIDEVFRVIGKQPVPVNSRLIDTFAEDFRRELAEIQEPEAKRLFVLSKVTRILHVHIGELVALVAAADVTGKYGVGVLLESVLADKLAFAERTRRFIRKVVEGKLEERKAA